MFDSVIGSKKHKNLGPLGVLLLLSVILCIALRSWRGWGDAVIDFPQQLYIAWRISVGDILYRDIQYFYGPFSQLFNGALFYFFGPGYIILAMANLAIASAITFLIYYSVWRAFDWACGLLAALAFVLIHIFQQMNLISGYNFVAPYSHEATHGTLFLITIIVLSAKIGSFRLGLRWFGIGLALGATYLTKPEFILAGSLVVGIKLILHLYKYRIDGKFILTRLGLGALIPIGGVWGYFFLIGDFSFLDSFRATFAAINPAPSTVLVSNPLYARAFGLDSYLWENFSITLKALGKVVVVLAVAFGIDLIEDKKKRNWIGVVFLSVVALLLLRPQVLQIESTWPFLSSLGLVLVCFLGWRRIIEGKSFELALFLGIGSLAVSLKIYFNASFAVFGFYLLVPCTVFLTILGFHILPKIQANVFSRSLYLRWAFAVLIGSISINAVLHSSWYYDQKTLPIGEGRDRFYSFGYVGEEFTSALLLKEVISRLGRLSDSKSTLMVVPEGLLVNYLLRWQNPTPFLQTFIVKTIYDASGGTEYILNRLEQRSPDYVLYLRRAPEFADPIYKIRGPDGFANAPLDWIEARYSEIDRIGPSSKDFSKLLAVFLRKKTP